MKIDKRTYDKDFDSFILIASKRLDDNQVMADINVGGSKQMIIKSIIAAMHSNPILAIFLMEAFVEIDKQKPLGKSLFELIVTGKSQLESEIKKDEQNCDCEACRIKTKIQNKEPLTEHEQKIVRDEIGNQLDKILKSI